MSKDTTADSKMFAQRKLNKIHLMHNAMLFASVWIDFMPKQKKHYGTYYNLFLCSSHGTIYILYKYTAFCHHPHATTHKKAPFRMAVSHDICLGFNVHEYCAVESQYILRILIARCIPSTHYFVN